MIVRAANAEDLDALAMLRDALWPKSIDFHRRALKGFFEGAESHTDQIIVATNRSDQLVGFAELRVRNYAEGSKNFRVPFLEGWYVSSDARRQGIGSALIDAAESWARSLGYSELASDSDLGNSAAIDAHLALGFSEVERNVCFLKEL